MSLLETAALGALAGLTIFVGLPLGRITTLSPRARVGLAMFSVGILTFILVDVLGHALSIVEGPVERLHDGNGSLGHAVWLVLMLGAGFVAGSAGLAMIERRMRPSGPKGPPIAGGATAVVANQADALAGEADAARTRALHTCLAIAGAIGLHNFAEGLAIGVSARAGAISLATVLIIGFALHNATEGFGIVGPLGGVQPSWKWLGLVGLVAGGPTFFGALVGYHVTSQALELAFYALAGGAILYVVGEIWHAMRRFGHRELGLYLLAIGFLAGLVTDLVVVYGGG
ncbi:MAG: zinc transporter, family [Solirubrobacteraceae bacterium]|jgi:ZIP family zinc transporter|nr:zinc transporter, family [Solirubrobacteraceae bacterium]